MAHVEQLLLLGPEDQEPSGHRDGLDDPETQYDLQSKGGEKSLSCLTDEKKMKNKKTRHCRAPASMMRNPTD